MRADPEGVPAPANEKPSNEQYLNKTAEVPRSMFCMAQVDGATVQLILDSGSSGSVISKQFLEKVGRKIDQPSHINMIGINGEKRRASGEIKSLPIVIQQQLLPINVVVSEATGYDVLVGNDWLTKYQAKLDWEKQTLTFNAKEKTFTVDAACWKKITIIEDSDDEFEQEQQNFHLELEDESFIATNNGLQVNDEQFSWEYLEWVEQYDDLDEEFDKDSLRQKIELLTPEEKKQHEVITGQIIKYFDNNGDGKQPVRAYESDAGLDLFYMSKMCYRPFLLATIFYVLCSGGDRSPQYFLSRTIFMLMIQY